jgi:putative ABC transport system substrate-binding protein
MQRRSCVAGALAAVVQQSLHATAAQAAEKLRRVGVLSQDTSLANEAGSNAQWQEFVAELARRGHVERRNLVFEQRFGEFGRLETLDPLAAELVRLKVDVIFAFGGTASALAAKRATTTIPVIFNSSADPVALGLVESLARPGGNLTGNSILNSNLGPKNMQILAEAAGKLTSIADIQPPAIRRQPWFAGSEAAMTAGATALGARFQYADIDSVADFEALLKRLAGQGVDGVLVESYSPFRPHLKQMAGLLIKYRMPSVGDPRQGFLLSYGLSWNSLARSSAKYVDQILRGAKPADLPVEQPTQFELVINLNTAKALGLTLPKALLLRADEVLR